MEAYAIANEDGTVKHLAIWHHNARGPSPLCYQAQVRPGFNEDGSIDKTVLFEFNPGDIDRPWCSRCELKVEAMVRAISLRIPEVSR